MKKKQIICYVAGKSGGHIIPCLTLAHEHKQQRPEDDILFFTTESILDIEIVSKNRDITWHVPLPLKQISRKSLLDAISFGFQLLRTVLKTCFYLIKHRPQKVICTGGFLAIPVILCARILAIHAELLELNVLPGKATRFLSSWSIKILTCFEQTKKYLPKKKCIKTAYPIRFFGEDAQMSQKDALNKINFSKQRKTIVVLGGSQGSLEINSLIKRWIIAQVQMHAHIQIVHQTGRRDTFNWSAFYAQHNIPAKVFSFSHDMAAYYAAADLIICRSGAGTLFEILFFGKQCITIPLVTANNDHQVANALAMHEEYGDQFEVIASQQLKHDPYIFFATINKKLNLDYAQAKEPIFAPHEIR